MSEAMIKSSGGPGPAASKDAAGPSNLALEPSESFVLTPQVQRVADRALAYLRAGCPVHFSGPAGTGKTTLALHIAALRGRPVTLMHGDEELGSRDLVGGEYGYRRSKLVDNFIHSVVKTEESATMLWADNRLTDACRRGETLVYDEYTRSRPEANNSLLSVLEERLLTLPGRLAQGDNLVEVHPEFRAIFTSNPEEYAGVHSTQDALSDRLITIRMDFYDRDTEVAIAQSKSGIPQDDARVIVDIVREVRALGLAKQGPSLRASIKIARVVVQLGARACAGDSTFTDVCRDVMSSMAAEGGGRSDPVAIDGIIAKHTRRGA